MIYPYVSEQLKPRIMKRIYGIWFLKRVAPWFGLEIMALSVFIFYINTHIALSSVVGNTITHTVANSTFSLLDFLYSAYLYTEMTIRLVLIGFATLLFLLTRNCLRVLVEYQDPLFSYFFP